jgi:hypothetical protein
VGLRAGVGSKLVPVVRGVGSGRGVEAGGALVAHDNTCLRVGCRLAWVEIATER